MWIVIVHYRGDVPRIASPAHLFESKEDAISWARRCYGNTLDYLRYAQLGDMET